MAAPAYHDRHAPGILVNGTAVHTRGVEAEVMRDVALALGRAREALLVEDRARHTTENLRHAARMLPPRDWKRVLIVSDTFQLPFAMQAAPTNELIPDAQPTVPPLHGGVIREHVELDDVEPIPFICWW